MGATGLSSSVDLDSWVLCIPVWCGVGAVQELCVNVSFLGNDLSSLGGEERPSPHFEKHFKAAGCLKWFCFQS